MADLQGNTLTTTGNVAIGGSLTVGSTVVQGRVTLTYGTTIATDTSYASSFAITVTDGVAFTMSAPLAPVTGKLLTYTFKNTSGGAVGTITWNAAFKMAAFTTPATANQRSITFFYDGTNWVELYKTAADVPN